MFFESKGKEKVMCSRSNPIFMKSSIVFLLFIVSVINSSAQTNVCGLQIISPPSQFNSFYKKYVACNGIEIISTNQTSDSTFCIAYDIVKNMTNALPPSILDSMITHNGTLAIMAPTEIITDFPAYANYYSLFPVATWGIEWDFENRNNYMYP